MERSPDASKTSQTAADGGVEVERATNNTVAGAYQSWDLGIAQVASVGADWLAMRRIEAFLAASFQRGVARNEGPVFEDADLVGENVDVEDAPPRRVGYAVEIAADADHAFMRSAPLEPQHGPVGRGREGLSATLFPRRKPG